MISDSKCILFVLVRTKAEFMIYEIRLVWNIFLRQKSVILRKSIDFNSELLIIPHYD